MATNVFYSCGITATDLKSGSPNITLVSGTGTLTVAQPDIIGVGDIIDYDTDNKKAFISARTSSTVYTFTTATGTVPGDVTSKTVNSIKRAFTSQSSLESGASDASHLNTANLVTGDFILNAACYNDGDDTTAVAWNGYTTDATRFIKIFTPVLTSQVGVSQRHDGTEGTGYTIKPGTIDHGIEILDDNVIVEGIEVTDWSTNSSGESKDGININGDKALIDSCIVHDDGHGTDGGSDSGGIQLDGNFTAEVKNSTVYDLARYGIAIHGLGARTLNINNCTVFRCMQSDSASLANIYSRSTSNVVNVKNTISMDPFDVDFGKASGTINGDFCTDSDGSGTTEGFTNHQPSRTATTNASPGAGDFVIFENITDGTEDYHLKDSTDNDAQNTGTDLSGSGVTKDIDGDSRPQGSAYDRGSDEVVEAAVNDILYSRGLDRGLNRGINTI